MLNGPVQRGITVHVTAKTPLAVIQGAAIHAPLSIKDRQQRHADPTGLRGGDNALGHLRRVIIGTAIRTVMQIVKLSDCGESSLQHFHIGEGRNRLHILRR